MGEDIRDWKVGSSVSPSVIQGTGKQENMLQGKKVMWYNELEVKPVSLLGDSLE